MGAQAGGAYYDHTWSDRDAWSGNNADDLQRSNVNMTKSGFIGGVGGGYNWQSRCTLFGVEVDYNWARIRNSTIETDGDAGVNLDFLTVESRMRGFGTVRARTGLIVDNLLLYVTGGFAYSKFDRTYTQVDLSPPVLSETFTTNKTKWGWVGGFGTEWAWTQNWSIKSEVLYARFEQDEQTFTCTVFCPAPPQTRRFGHQDSVWVSRIGINYRFGGPVGMAY